MLILTRRENQTVRIGKDIYITVVRIDDGQVKLGFTAPESLSIVRTEILTAAKTHQSVAEPPPLATCSHDGCRRGSRERIRGPGFDPQKGG